MKAYRDLTCKGRLHRLRKLAESVLAAYELTGVSLSYIQYTANIINRVDELGVIGIKDHSGPYHPNRYVMRIHAMDDVEAIESDLNWLYVLNREADLSVPAPVLTTDG